MAYQNTIPQPTDKLKDSQADLLANFQAIQTLIEVNHATFGDANEGKHTFVTFPVQGSAPSFAAGEEGLYNQAYATTTKNELFVHKQSVDALTEVPCTASILSNTAVASCDSGWSYLPSGLLIKWGGLTAATASVTVDFQSLSGGPTYTRVFRVFVSPLDTGTAVNFSVGQRTVSTTTSFTAYCANPSGSTSLRYLILGV